VREFLGPPHTPPLSVRAPTSDHLSSSFLLSRPVEHDSHLSHRAFPSIFEHGRLSPGRCFPHPDRERPTLRARRSMVNFRHRPVHSRWNRVLLRSDHSSVDCSSSSNSLQWSKYSSARLCDGEFPISSSYRRERDSS